MKDERKTERNTEWNDEAEADRDFLREKLKNAGDPALPASLSAAALFERMDAADQQAAAPEKKGGVIWLQWRRWGSIAGTGGRHCIPVAEQLLAKQGLAGRVEL